MQKASTLADDLWPYLLPKVSRAVGNRNGGGTVIAGNGGSGSGSSTLAGLDDVALTALVDGQTLAYQASSSHWVNVTPLGGGSSYFAGLGIDITGSTISAKLKSSGGLNVDSAGLFIAKPLDSGLNLSLSGLAVGEGAGIDVFGGTVGVRLGTHSALAFDSGNGLTVDASIAGAGLSWDATNKVMAVGVAEGIEYVGDAIRVDEDYAFIWDGTHRFNLTPQLNSNLNFIGADRTMTSGPGIDLTIDLGTSVTPADLILAAPKTFRSADFLDDIPIAGFSLFKNSGNDRQLTINTIKSDSLHTRLFVADGVRIDIGEERWGKSMGIVHNDFTSPAAIGSTVTVYFEDSPMLTGALFSNNDWVLFRYLNQGSNFAFGSVWGQVTSYINRGLDADGRGYQSWTFTLRHGDAGVLVKKGNVAVDYGVSGQGYAFLSVLSDAVGPWFRIGTWSGSDPFTAGNTQIRTQIGRLDGISDTALNPAGYGLYSDNAYLHGMLRTAETVMDDDGLSIFYPTTSSISDPGGHALVAWRVNVDDRTAARPAQVAAWQAAVGGVTADEMSVRVRQSDTSDYADLILDAINTDPTGGTGSSIVVSSHAGISLQPQLGTQVDVLGHVIPSALYDVTFDLGSASVRWRNLYVDHLFVSGSIAGDTISGAEWEYPGSMVIDPHATGDTTLSIVNQGAGRADLVVDRDILVGGNVDGIDISAHAASPTAHHALATAGSGIVVASGQIISVDATVVRTPATVVRTSRIVGTVGPLTGGGDLSADLSLRLLLAAVNPGLTAATGALGVLLATGTPGLSLVGGLAVDSTVARSTTHIDTTAPLAGGGDLSATRTLFINFAASSGLSTAGGLAVADTLAGAGLFWSTPKVLAVDASQLVPSTRVLTAGAGLTGGGDLSLDRTFNVVAFDGTLTVNPDSVQVNQAYAFAWTGNQTWAGNATFSTGVLQFNTNPKVNANLDFIGGVRNITSPAVTNLAIVPGGDLILDPGGLNVLPGGSSRVDLGDYNRKWSTLYARELYVETLVASSVMATIGGRIMVTPTTSLIADITTTTVTTIDVKQNIASFGNGTYIYLESAPGTPPIPQIEAMKITSSATAISGGWRYSVTRGLNASGAKTWLAGDAVVSLGAAVSEGYIDLASVQTVKPISPTVQKVGPTITIYSRSSTTNWDDLVPTVTMGNLTSFVDYATTRYGFATGNDLTKAPDDPSTPFIGMTADRVSGVRLFNTPLNLYNTGNAILTIDKINGISFEFGTSAFNTIGWYEDLGIPPASPLVAKLLGTVGVARTVAGYTELDIIGQGIAGSYATGAVKLRGQNSASVGYNLWLDASGAYFGSASSGVRSQTGGFISDSVQYFSGNVGIGTSAPAGKLDVRGAGTATGIRVGYNSTNSVRSDWFAFSNAVSLLAYNDATSAYVPITFQGNPLIFDIGTTEYMRVDTGGNVGIGTSAPAGKLDVRGAGASTGIRVGYDTASSVRSDWLAFATAVSLLAYNDATSAYVPITFQGNPLIFDIGTTEYMRVHTTGNVGIGNAAPGTLLQIGPGTTPIANLPGIWVTPNTTVANVTVRNSGGAEGGLFVFSDNVGYMGMFSNHALNIRTNNANRLTITAAGAVTVASTLGVTGLLTASAGVNLGQSTLTQYDESPVVWTPTITSAAGAITISYGTRSGVCTRIGNRVDIQGLCIVSTTITGTGAGGILRMSVPFTNPSANGVVGTCWIVASSTWLIASFYIGPGTNYGQIYYQGSGTSATQMLCNSITLGMNIYFAATYFV